ncbi:MAG: hypothetical protein QMC36_00865 [Patescibacteria group bacterium]
MIIVWSFRTSSEVSQTAKSLVKASGEVTVDATGCAGASDKYVLTRFL